MNKNTLLGNSKKDQSVEAVFLCQWVDYIIEVILE